MSSSKSGVGCGGIFLVLILGAVVYWLYQRGIITTGGSTAYLTTIFTDAFAKIAAFFKGFGM